MNTHPAADLFPLMGDDELRQLASDIQEHGQREAIVMHEGLILDGRNRWAACEGIGIRPVTRQFDPACDGQSLTAYVISANLRRRDLTAGQRAFIGLEILPLLKQEAKERQRAAGGIQNPRSEAVTQHSAQAGYSHPGRNATATEEAGFTVGVSHWSIDQARQLADQSPDLAEQVRSGKKTLSGAAKELARRQPSASKGGETTKKKRRVRAMSDAEFDTQLADAQQQTKAAFAYEALEHLGRCRFTPAEVAAAVPANQRHRIDEFLKPSLDWLQEFHHIWTANDPA